MSGFLYSHLLTYPPTHLLTYSLTHTAFCLLSLVLHYSTTLKSEEPDMLIDDYFDQLENIINSCGYIQTKIVHKDKRSDYVGYFRADLYFHIINIQLVARSEHLSRTCRMLYTKRKSKFGKFVASSLSGDNDGSGLRSKLLSVANRATSLHKFQMISCA